MELEAAQEWSYYPRKKTRGILQDKGTHFFVSLEVGRIGYAEPKPKLNELKASSTNRGYYFKLLKPSNAGSSTTMNKSGHFAIYNFRAYTLLQSKTPIKRDTFKELHVVPTGKLIYLPSSRAQYQKGQIIIDTPYIKRSVHKESVLEVFIETGFTSSSGEDGVSVKQIDSVILKYKTNQTIERMTSDFAKVRNLLMLTSYFENDFNDVSMELRPPKLNRERSNTVKLSTKNYRKIAIESENRPRPPHSWLFSGFISNAKTISNNYFELLNTTDLRTSIDFYLAVFLPAKQNGVLEQWFLYSVLIIESLYERFIENFEDETERKRKKLKQCSKCGRDFCDHCAPIEYTNLETKLRKIVDQYITGTGSEKYFKSLDYAKIATTRNHTAHVKIAGKKDLLEYGDMFDVAIRFEYLFIYTVLKSIGYEPEELDKSLPTLDAFNGLRY